MYYLPLAVITWGSLTWMIDRRRLPELLRYGLLGSVLATVQDRLVILYRLWEYRDVGWFDTHPEIALLISLSAAPIFGMRFAQGLKPGAPIPWGRIARFTLVAMLPEVAALYADHIRYHNWWHIGWSVLAYLPIWLSFWALHRWMTAPAAPAPTRPEKETAPGT